MESDIDLNENEIHCWLVKTDQFSPSLLVEDLKFLPCNERQRIDKCECLNNKNEMILARVMLRYALSLYEDVPPEQWQFDFGRNGKPRASTEQLRIQFNISHSGGVVAIAICRNHEIGIDVEKIVDDKMLLDLAFRYFSPSEYADICAHGQSQIVRFFEYWTLKESFSKANGAGLYIPLNLFNFSIGVSSYDNRINRNIQTTQKGSNIAFRVGRIGW